MCSGSTTLSFWFQKAQSGYVHREYYLVILILRSTGWRCAQGVLPCHFDFRKHRVEMSTGNTTLSYWFYVAQGGDVPREYYLVILISDSTEWRCAQGVLPCHFDFRKHRVEMSTGSTNLSYWFYVAQGGGVPREYYLVILISESTEWRCPQGILPCHIDFR